MLLFGTPHSEVVQILEYFFIVKHIFLFFFKCVITFTVAKLPFNKKQNQTLFTLLVLGEQSEAALWHLCLILAVPQKPGKLRTFVLENNRHFREKVWL